MPSYNEKLAHWDVLSANLTQVLPEVPFLEVDQKALASFVAEGRTLAARQESEYAALRETIRQRRELERKATRLRESLVAVLRLRLGPYNQQLAALGIKPRPARIRKKSPDLPDPSDTGT